MQKRTQIRQGLFSSRRQQQKPQLDQETQTELQEAFNLFDSEQTGEIDVRELKACMKAFSVNIKKEELRQIMRNLGKQTVDGITFQEFLQIMSGRMGDRNSKEEILKIFNLFDLDNNNGVTFENLKQIASEIGENISDEELYEMFEEADRDSDQLINFNEFFRVMRKREDPLDDWSSDEEM